MPSDPTRHFQDPAEAQQQFLSLFLRSERELFRYVVALVPNVADAEDIVQQTALVLWEKFSAYDPGQPFTPWACRFARRCRCLATSRAWWIKRGAISCWARWRKCSPPTCSSCCWASRAESKRGE